MLTASIYSRQSARPNPRFRCGLVIGFILLMVGCGADDSKKIAGPELKSEWALHESFVLETDTEGFRFPTSIAFVPNPGSGPKDVLYFVTELRGSLKVVTNDRSVFTFAETFFHSKPADELPLPSGEVGMAGVCLDPENGHVFVTFAYQDPENITYNNIIRFTSTPVTFSLKPTAMLSFSDIFSKHESGVSHQIGNCQVSNGRLFVGVGDAHRHFDSQRLDNIGGKILRLSTDGSPVPDNPFYTDQNKQNAANHIYAYGMRNAFALRLVEGRLFAAENGPEVDRFNEIEPAANYLWDGTDWSIGSRASAVLRPNIGPVQMDYLGPEASVFPNQYRGRFFVSTSGRIPGIVELTYDFKKRIMADVPKPFVQYAGTHRQMVTGLAFGPDGLYFSPLFPNEGETTPVLKIRYSPDARHRLLISENLNPLALMTAKGCFSCHSMSEDIQGVGPSLKRESLFARLEERLDSDEYRASIASLDQVDREPYRQYQNARQHVLNTKGTEQLRLWVKYHLLEPKFDNPNSQMPNLQLSEAEAVRLADFLLGVEKTDAPFMRLRIKIKQLYPRIRYRHLLYSFVAGMGFLLILGAIVRRSRRKRKS
jgi:hypothetical protein